MTTIMIHSVKCQSMTCINHKAKTHGIGMLSEKWLLLVIQICRSQLAKEGCCKIMKIVKVLKLFQKMDWSRLALLLSMMEQLPQLPLKLQHALLMVKGRHNVALDLVFQRALVQILLVRQELIVISNVLERKQPLKMDWSQHVRWLIVREELLQLLKLVHSILKVS